MLSTEISSSTIQQKATEHILFNIATKGLKPKKTLRTEGVDCIGSGDGSTPSLPVFESWEGNFICINEINLNTAPGKDFATKTKPLMDEISVGAWPITLEREYKLHFKNKTELLEEMEERLKHSLLLILKPQPNAPFAKPIYADDEATMPSYQEKRFTNAGIPAEQIIAVIAPKSLQSMTQKYFPQVPLYLIEFTKEKVTFPLYEVLKYWPNHDISKDIRATLSTPNFITGLQAHFKASKQPSFACHVVRLPTIRDTQYGLENQLDLYKMPQDLLQAEVHPSEQETAIMRLQSAIKMVPVRQTFLQYYQLHKIVQEKLSQHQLKVCTESLPALQALQQKLASFTASV